MRRRGGVTKPEDRVDRAPFLAFVERRQREGWSLNELAEEVTGRTGETSWLKLRLGLKPNPETGTVQHLSYRAAVRLVRGWRQDPVDFGV